MAIMYYLNITNNYQPLNKIVLLNNPLFYELRQK